MKQFFILGFTILMVAQSTAQTVQMLDNCETLTGWDGSHYPYALDNGDFKEGTASVRGEGSGTDLFKKGFTTPFNTGVDRATGYFAFWLYVSDVSKMINDGQIEISSSGGPDVNELHWSFSNALNLANGWNNIILKLSDGETSGGEANLAAINFVRFYRPLSGSIVTKIDALRFANSEEVLPIKFNTLNVSIQQGRSTIEWETLSEENTAWFDVQRSNDGNNFTSIAKVTANGLPNQRQQYIAYDEAPLSGVNYYKIIGYDKDGKMIESAIKSLLFSKQNTTGVTIFPNPGKSVFTLTGNGFEKGILWLRLTDMTGKKVAEKKLDVPAGSTRLPFSFNQPVSPGLYLLHFTANGNQEMIKIVIK